MAIRQGRYTWRHNNVLAYLKKDFLGIVDKTNKLQLKSKSSRKIQRFVQQGHNAPARPKPAVSLLTKHAVSDWQINLDLHDNLTIPPETKVDTLSRPDIVIYSVSAKVII